MQKQPERVGQEARELALNIIYDVTEKGAYANLSLDKALRAATMPANDKRLVTELVNGTLRMSKHLDWVLHLFMQKPMEKQNPWLRCILRMSAYQLLFLEKIPDYAAVNSAVELSRKKAGKALSGVSNGVLRNLIRSRSQIVWPDNAEAYLSVYYSQPDWLTRMWLQEYGPEQTEKMFIYLNQRAGLSLRNNELLGSRAELMQNLAAEQVEAAESPLLPWAVRVEFMEQSLEELQAFQQGRFYIQNEASMLAAAILDPQPGSRILDLCCGVGGKSTHFAERMQNLGSIKAVDLYEHKITLLQKNCQRLRINIVEACKQDILAMTEEPLWNGVFLDAPCSGLGVLNRRADSRWRKNPGETAALTKLQSALLQKAGAMVEPGGTLVYATCTINKMENEDIVQAFLARNHDYAVADIHALIPFFPLDLQDQNHARQGFLTLLPGKYQTDGMFYARLRRSRSS